MTIFVSTGRNVRIGQGGAVGAGRSCAAAAGRAVGGLGDQDERVALLDEVGGARLDRRGGGDGGVGGGGRGGGGVGGRGRRGARMGRRHGGRGRNLEHGVGLKPRGIDPVIRGFQGLHGDVVFPGDRVERVARLNLVGGRGGRDGQARAPRQRGDVHGRMGRGRAGS